jgi:hypothetical protein
LSHLHFKRAQHHRKTISMGAIFKYFESTSLYVMGFQPAASGPRFYYAARGHSVNWVSAVQIHNKLGSYVYHLLLFFHVRPAKQPALPVVALCHETWRPVLYAVVHELSRSLALSVKMCLVISAQYL